MTATERRKQSAEVPASAQLEPDGLCIAAGRTLIFTPEAADVREGDNRLAVLVVHVPAHALKT